MDRRFYNDLFFKDKLLLAFVSIYNSAFDNDFNDRGIKSGKNFLRACSKYESFLSNLYS